MVLHLFAAIGMYLMGVLGVAVILQLIWVYWLNKGGLE